MLKLITKNDKLSSIKVNRAEINRRAKTMIIKEFKTRTITFRTVMESR